ncbi:MAG: lipoyl(octanoyl) transferase LipB [Proteobacteria bacterium]|nr:lipoyl(octanoyl) transferase LipB [Pseudomonadota bacterium]
MHRYLRDLEEAVIQTCAHFGLIADREPKKTGVWTTLPDGARKKLCSMGIACRKWVVFHGLALNVTTDLSYFRRINPCGFESAVMTSMATLIPDVTVDAVRPVLAAQLATQLRRA